MTYVPTGVPTVDNDSRINRPTQGARMRRDVPVILFAAAVVCFGVAFVSMLSTEVDVGESVWITAGLLASAVAFFLKELH